MRNFINTLELQNISRGILIWSDKMTAAARKVIDAMRQQFRLEDFEEAYLLVNITHHHLVPEHYVMSAEEKRELLQRYRLKDSQLPRIQINDPVARYFGLQRGQVVKITRRECERTTIPWWRYGKADFAALSVRTQHPRRLVVTARTVSASEERNHSPGDSVRLAPHFSPRPICPHSHSLSLYFYPRPLIRHTDIRSSTSPRAQKIDCSLITLPPTRIVRRLPHPKSYQTDRLSHHSLHLAI